VEKTGQTVMAGPFSEFISARQKNLVIDFSSRDGTIFMQPGIRMGVNHTGCLSVAKAPFLQTYIA
jgi:hypothetical protein